MIGSSRSNLARQIAGAVCLAIGLALVLIYFAQINRSGVATTPTALADRSSPIATVTLPPIASPSPTIEVKPIDTSTIEPTATITDTAIPTRISTLIPTKIVATSAPRPTETNVPATLAPPTSAYSIRYRIGLGVGNGERAPGTLQHLAPGFYLTWGLKPIADAAADYWPMVRLITGQSRIDFSIYTNYARSHPGLLWLIGNEPDVLWQDNSTPEEYAAAYHAAYTARKAADPSSRIAIAGVSQPTPLRLQYLDRVLAAYQDQFGEALPIDVWNIHNFILNEQRGSWGIGIPPGFDVDSGQLHSIDQHDDFGIFRQQIVDFRTWLAARGYRDKELIVSEYGILMPPDYGFDHARVRDFMIRTFDYFSSAMDYSIGFPGDGNRLVQRWCWFSLSDSDYPAGNLIDYDSGQITPLGQDFVTYLQTR